MTDYLAATEHINWQHPSILAQAAALAAGCADPAAITRACFEFVRDQIRHSWDARNDADNPVTCTASDVLAHRTGYCYAKSHLLAALLRANGIPAALCYQRLTIDGDQGPYCLHGLNAVFLPEHGWYRIDARGNKPGVAAEFVPPVERLAFAIQHPGEADLPGLWSEPMPAVLEVLTRSATVADVYHNLPDAVPA